MKKKKILLILGLFLIFIGFTVYNAELFNDYTKWKIDTQKANIKYCSENDISPEQEISCKEALDNPITEISFYNVFEEIQLLGGKHSLFFVYGLLLVTLIFPLDYFKDEQVVEDINEIGYKKTINKTRRRVMLGSLIFPVLSIVVMIISYIFNPTFVAVSNVSWPIELIKNPIIFISTYLFNVWIHSAIYILLGLLVIRFVKHYLMSTFITFLILFVIQYLLSLFTPYNIFAFLYLNYYNNIFVTLLIPIIIYIIVYILYKVSYKNEDKFLLYLKKNY